MSDSLEKKHGKEWKVGSEEREIGRGKNLRRKVGKGLTPTRSPSFPSSPPLPALPSLPAPPEEAYRCPKLLEYRFLPCPNSGFGDSSRSRSPSADVRDRLSPKRDGVKGGDGRLLIGYGMRADVGDVCICVGREGREGIPRDERGDG